MYRIEVSPSAERDLDSLKKRIQKQEWHKIRDAVRSLAGDPFPVGVRKIQGTEKAYRIRAGSYRIVYEFHADEKLVLILQVGRRNESTYRPN